MRGLNITPTERERIADLLRLGIDRKAIASRFRISADRVTHIAGELRKAGKEIPMFLKGSV